MPSTRRPRTRLLLTLAALASLIVGYYLGQFWQRRSLSELSAVVYPAGRAIDLQAFAALADGQPAWRLFLTVDTTEPACAELLRDYNFARNRLAAAPHVQRHLRLTLLAYDRPDDTRIHAYSGAADWIDVISAEPRQLDPLAAELGILPNPGYWCQPTQSNAILVSPKAEAWAMIPREQPAQMAGNIRAVIEFVE
jgi:hypothetical protein